MLATKDEAPGLRLAENFRNIFSANCVFSNAKTQLKRYTTEIIIQLLYMQF